MPPPQNLLVNQEFKPVETNFKSPMVQCIHCNSETGRVAKINLQRKKDHLAKCDAYQTKIKREGSPAKSINPVLPFQKLPVAVKAQRERLLARAIYAGGLPFSLFDPVKHPEWSDFVHSFDASWHPPSRERLGGSLLDEDYERVSNQVNTLLQGEMRLNLTADESTAANSDRVANIAVNTAAGGSFHLCTTSVDDRNVTAQEVARMVTTHAKELTKGDLLRWNSICTDTCSTMRSMHQLLEKEVATKHVFTVLCDSHGLQLFVKDIFDHQEGVPYYISALADASYLSNTLRKTKLSLSIIRRVATENNLSFRAFATAAITRWGSHFQVLNSLVESREVLWRARGDPRLFRTLTGGYIRGGERAEKLLYDHQFWHQIEHLHSFLKAVNTAQIISEGDRSSVGQIISRLDDLSEAISDLNLPFSKELCDRLDHRLNQQTTAIHWAARALDPETPEVSLEYTAEHIAMVRTFLLKHTPEERHQSLNHQFAEFRHLRGSFARLHEHLWAYANDYITFWDIASSQAPDLSHIAMRLHETPANSVPSERSFSAMNFIQNDYRTRLSTTKTNKLTYIFMNTKALRRRPILEGHHRERRVRRQAREKAAATRKDLRQKELEMLQSEGAALGAVGAAIKLEQLPNDDLDALYEQAVAAMPDSDIDEIVTMPVPPGPAPIMPPTVTQYTYPPSNYEGSYIDPVLIFGNSNDIDKRLYSQRDSYTTQR